MLTYVFWHWRSPDTSPDAYEELLSGFFRALTAAPSPGLLDARTYAVSGLPWAAAGGAAYEDWYTVEGSAALDPLNQAAVSASRQVPHDRVAAAAGGGTAGLYLLRLGAPVSEAKHAWWFAKPSGMRYPALFELLKPVCDAGAALWGRQMTLGPGPEFCLQAPKLAVLPPVLVTNQVELRRVWPGRV